MKKYIIILCSFVILLGCNDDFLNQENPNTLTPDQFWKDEADATSAIVGAYSPLSTVFCHGRLFHGMTQALSDAIRVNSDFSRQASLYDLDAGNARIKEGWGEYWKVVFRTNLVIENVPNIEMDEDLKNNIIGEAYFLRAYSYFILVNYFKNIPLITVAGTNISEAQQPQVDESLVWQQIKDDLTTAIPLLPNTWDSDNKGRVMKSSAAALLGRTHLYLEEWTEASTELKRIIDGEFGTIDLAPTYAENFRESGQNNIESLFEIQFDATGAWTAGWGADVPSTARFHSLGQDYARGGHGEINEWVLDLFLSELTNGGDIDPRAYETIIWDYPGAEHFGQPFTSKYSREIQSANDDGATYVRSAKYVNPNGGGDVPAFNTFAVNKKIIRFADVLLMYAEAENEANNGPTSNAYTAVNRVRARVDMPDFAPGMDQETFRQKLRDERVLELTLEDIRQLDLLRWGMLPDRITDNEDFRTGNLSYVPGREYFPIPQLEMDTNPQINEQNPGYE